MTEKEFNELKVRAITRSQELASAWNEIERALKAEKDPKIRKALEDLQAEIMKMAQWK